MGTLQIFSNKADDLLFLNEMARRMNLKTKMQIPETGTQPAIDYEDSAEGVVEAIKRGLEFERKLDAGMWKCKL
jgi:hypothetical protein